MPQNWYRKDEEGAEKVDDVVDTEAEHLTASKKDLLISYQICEFQSFKTHNNICMIL